MEKIIGISTRLFPLLNNQFIEIQYSLATFMVDWDKNNVEVE
jgi:hypothetical protein